MIGLVKPIDSVNAYYEIKRVVAKLSYPCDIIYSAKAGIVFRANGVPRIFCDDLRSKSI